MKGAVVFLTRAEESWPPREHLKFMENDDYGGSVTVSVDEEGCICLCAEHRIKPCMYLLTFKSQPISVEKGSAFIVTASWSHPSRCEIRVNGRKLRSFWEDRSVIVLAPSLPLRQATRARIFAELAPSAPIRSDEWYFQKMVQELDEITHRGDEYSLIRSSLILRQLLLDGFVHTVNTSKVKLRFDVSSDSPYSTLRSEILFSAPDIDPEPYNRPIQNLSLRDFLEKHCVTYLGNAITVADVIRATAHSLGGAHRDSPRTPKDRVLVDLSSSISIAGDQQDVVLRVIASISRVTLRALKPLLGAT
jgi:hypothetical protein